MNARYKIGDSTLVVSHSTILDVAEAIAMPQAKKSLS
jgi:hypothetical protein